MLCDEGTETQKNARERGKELETFYSYFVRARSCDLATLEVKGGDTYGSASIGFISWAMATPTTTTTVTTMASIPSTFLPKPMNIFHNPHQHQPPFCIPHSHMNPPTHA